MMSGAGASDISDAVDSITCLVLSQAKHSPAFEQCQESRGTGKAPGYCWQQKRGSHPKTRTDFQIIHSERADQLFAADKIRLWLLRVSRFRFTTSAHRMTGQSVDPRLVFLSVKKSLSLGHGCDRLAYPEATLLKIVSK